MGQLFSKLKQPRNNIQRKFVRRHTKDEIAKPSNMKQVSEPTPMPTIEELNQIFDLLLVFPPHI